MASRRAERASRKVEFPFAPPRSSEATPTTREALIAAAAVAFGEAGYDGVTIRDVERRAGVNRGLVAHHFGTKDELWSAAIDWLMGEVASELDRYADMLDVVPAGDRPGILMRIFVRFASRHPELFQLLIQEGNNDSERSRMLSDRYMRELERFWWQATGVDPDLDPASHAIRHFLLLGASSTVFAMRAYCQRMFGVDPTDEAFVERSSHVIAEMWQRVGQVVEGDPDSPAAAAPAE
ncbi:MAG: TetR/AcrR family transcriptional regulator [Solirubrobacteraceae bacterium]